MTEIEKAIKDEMRKAFVRLEAKPDLLRRVDAADKLDTTALYRAAERLGAGRLLLAIIGSRGDTMSDEEVLAALRDWNEGRPFFDKFIASVQYPDRPPDPSD